MNPRWNLQGTRIGYEVNYPDRKFTEMFIADVEARTENRVAAPVAGGGRTGGRLPVVHQLSWHPQGSLFAYSASDPSGNYDVFVHTVGRGFGQPAVTDGGPAFSPNGQSVAYVTAASGSGEIWILDLARLEQGPRKLLGSPTAKVDLAWTPDSRGLLYEVLGDNGDNLVLIPDVTRPDMTRRLTDWKSSQIRGSVAQDGKTVAFYSNYGQKDSTRFDLYVLSLLGGAARKIASDAIPNGGHGPSWTPDGQGVVYAQRDPSRGDPVCIAWAAGGPTRCLSTDTRNNIDPDVVGKGGLWRVTFASQAATSSDDKTWRRVYVMDIAPGKGP